MTRLPAKLASPVDPSQRESCAFDSGLVEHRGNVKDATKIETGPTTHEALHLSVTALLNIDPKGIFARFQRKNPCFAEHGHRAGGK